jgi:translation initiation factor IF-3
MALSKQNRRPQNLPTINERIRFPQIRVIDTDGGQLGIMEPHDALQMAQKKDLGLVLIDGW